jgi:hypothetical protein
MISTSKLYIKNNYKYSDINEKSVLEQIENYLHNSFKKFIRRSPPESCYKIYSNGKNKIDYSMYSGTGGNIYAYWRYHLLNKNKGLNTDTTLTYIKQAYNVNLLLVKKEENVSDFTIYNQSSSFFHGPIGVYTIGCILSNEIKDESAFIENFKGLKKYKELALSNYSEDELLYGNAGYLYSLSFIYKHCILSGNFKTHYKDIQLDMIDIIQFLYEIGISKKEEKNSKYMIFPFPRNESKKHASKTYLGGAHGIFGVLYEMLVAINLLSDNYINENIEIIKNVIKNDLIELSKLQFDSGNFPSSLKKSSDDLIQFCHGATGAVLVYGLAYTIFKEELFLKIALNCGDSIWERGILKKGNGICHGITGNAYGLYYIYKITSNSDWLNKAYCMTLASIDKDIQNICSEYDHPQRMVTGIPDTPYSLMEGEGGSICLYSDILNGSEYMLFPGFEV